MVDRHEAKSSGTDNKVGLKFPSGLLGFETIKDFDFLSVPGEEPFVRLKARGEPAISFLVIAPFEVLPDYQPDIPPEDVSFLGLTSPQDAFLLNIVTLRLKERSTVNLKGPIVVNRHTMVAKQVVLANAAQYSVQHPLPLAE